MKEILHQLKFRWWCSQRPGMTDAIFGWPLLNFSIMRKKKNYENQDFNKITKEALVVMLLSCRCDEGWLRRMFSQLELFPAIRTRWAACPGPQRKETQLSERCRSVLTLPKINMFIIAPRNWWDWKTILSAFFGLGSKQRCGANSLTVSFIFGCLNPPGVESLRVWLVTWWLQALINYQLTVHFDPRCAEVLGVDDLAATVDSSEILR